MSPLSLLKEEINSCSCLTKILHRAAKMGEDWGMSRDLAISKPCKLAVNYWVLHRVLVAFVLLFWLSHFSLVQNLKDSLRSRQKWKFNFTRNMGSFLQLLKGTNVSLLCVVTQLSAHLFCLSKTQNSQFVSGSYKLLTQSEMWKSVQNYCPAQISSEM